MNAQELKEVLNLHEWWLMGHSEGVRAELTSMDLRGFDFTDAKLKGARLVGSNISRSIFRKADLREAELSNCNLSHCNFGEADLRACELRGADLSATRLTRANLGGANLTGANLSGASLGGVELDGAQLGSANLSGARGILYASVSWVAHGECGRALTAYSVDPFEEAVYSCGCVTGSAKVFAEYIDSGPEGLKASRTLAFDFVKARMAEMM